MNHKITNCRECVLYHVDFEGYAQCTHPNDIEGFIDCKKFPEDKVKESCPLKESDLILTIKE